MAVAFRWVLLCAHEDQATLFTLVSDSAYSATESLQGGHPLVRHPTIYIEVSGIRVPPQLVA